MDEIGKRFFEFSEKESTYRIIGNRSVPKLGNIGSKRVNPFCFIQDVGRHTRRSAIDKPNLKLSAVTDFPLVNN